MSNQAITWALETGTGGPATKVLLIAIANYANEANESYPSINRLAEETDQSPASVKRHLAKLIEMGLIVRTLRGGENGGRVTNRYTLVMPERVTAQSDPGLELNLSRGLGLNSGGVRAQSEGGLGSTVSPEPIEPKEPKDMFTEFWAAYPRRVGRGHAVKAWKTALKKADGSVLVEAARRFAAAKSGSDPKFIAHPATWLNGERWLDEVESNHPEPNLPEWMRG